MSILKYNLLEYIMDFIKSEYESKKHEREIHLNNLEKIIIDSNVHFEGNCFYYHDTLNIFPELYSKQLNLFWCGKQAVENICEIGFNAGHSTMLMLLGRPNTPINFTIFDIGHHLYTKPSFEYIKSEFSYVNFEYVEGDSTIIIPEWINKNQELMYKYDVVHVDGGHSEHCISNDMKNADLLVKKNGIVIIDDTDGEIINKYVDLYISNGNYVEMNLLSTYGYPHRVIKKIK
jgi:Methyltransferase domain